MEILAFTLAAGETKTFRKAGSYLEIIQSAGAVNVAFYSVNGGQTDSINGGLSGLFMATPYGAFTITEATGQAQAVQILVCDPGETGGSRRQPGVVQVVDTASTRTKSGQAFMWRFTGNGAAGQYPTCTLANPAGSGKRIVIESFVIGSSGAGTLTLGIANGSVVGAANAAPVSKISNGGSSIAVCNANSSATLGGGVGTAPLFSVFSTSQSIEFALQEPIVLVPGGVLGIQGELQGATISGGVEYYEEALTS